MSHNGESDCVPQKSPRIREALVFHYLDDLDSKMAAARAALAGESGDEEWSVYSAALQRKFLKLDRYLQPARETESPAAARPASQAAVQVPLEQAIEKADQGS